ncbi:MAG: hypothetical protein J0I02_08995, partial [Alphaproteobacteria bacterium]|nr:hypothetical protein [Alphaproteobacteria bacterium]
FLAPANLIDPLAQRFEVTRFWRHVGHGAPVRVATGLVRGPSRLSEGGRTIGFGKFGVKQAMFRSSI